MSCKNCECETTKPVDPLDGSDKKSTGIIEFDELQKQIDRLEKHYEATQEFLKDQFPEILNNCDCLYYSLLKKEKIKTDWEITRAIENLVYKGYTVIPPVKLSESDKQTIARF